MLGKGEEPIPQTFDAPENPEDIFVCFGNNDQIKLSINQQ